MPWAVQDYFPITQPVTESWRAVPFVPVAGGDAFGYRVVPSVPAYPENWQFGGIVHYGEVVDGVIVLSPHQQFTVYRHSTLATVRLVGRGRLEEISGSVTAQFAVFSLNDWLPVAGIETWVHWS